ncbi:type VII secretion system-associated protein [Nocardia sp. NPDC004750]
MLLDPNRSAGEPQDPVPEAIMGGWMIDGDGKMGPFEPNPTYLPADPASPTDPTDAVLRLIAAGDDVGDQLVPALRDAVVELGCDEQGHLSVAAAPDDVPCVLVVTAAAHKRRLDVVGWVRVIGRDLPSIVPAGTDIWINPGSPAQFRLVTAALW